jgi:hypothetical protein
LYPGRPVGKLRQSAALPLCVQNLHARGAVGVSREPGGAPMAAAPISLDRLGDGQHLGVG